MANLDGIIPALPSGGQMSNRQQYGPGNSNNPNYFEQAFDPAMAEAANQSIYASLAPGSAEKSYYQAHPLYQAGGYIYGYNDPNNPTGGTASFSNNLTQYVAGGKIIPSQYGMTAAQSVGQAQFSSPFSSSGQAGTPPDPGGNFTTGPAGPQSQTPGPQSNQTFLFGFNGDNGQMAGTFGSTQAGQSTPFYSQQPASQIQNQSGLGTLQQLTPQQQALISAR